VSKIRDLKHRIFGKKGEKASARKDKPGPDYQQMATILHLFAE